MVITLLCGCNREEQRQPSGVVPTQKAELPQGLATPQQGSPLSGVSANDPLLLVNPVPLQQVELPAEALALWRGQASKRPTLLILSGSPMITPIPQELEAEARYMAEHGTQQDLARSGSLQVSNPLLLPQMTVDLALRSGWFSQVVWALPLRDANTELSLEVFRQLLMKNQMLNDEEIRQLRVEKHLLRGTVRGTPLLVAPLEKLPPLTGPMVVHIDLSYFKERIKNEMATPVLPVVFETLFQLREKRLPVGSVTFCPGNVEERISLDVRFLGEVLAYFVEHPERDRQKAPPNWQRMADLFHLESLFEHEKMMALALAMEKDDPESAWVKFALYRAAAANKAGDNALKYLAVAVKRDQIYAVEYLALAQMAYEKRRLDASLQMLQLAAAAFPDNPRIRLEIAKIYSELGHNVAARQLVDQLRQLPWSSVYFPDMPAYLRGFDQYLQAPAATAVESAPAAPAKGISPPRNLMGRHPR